MKEKYAMLGKLLNVLQFLKKILNESARLRDFGKIFGEDQNIFSTLPRAYEYFVKNAHHHPRFLI